MHKSKTLQNYMFLYSVSTMEILVQEEFKFNLGLSVGIEGLPQCNAESPNENQNSDKW